MSDQDKPAARTPDLPTRLRGVWDGSTAFDMCHEAADEIERLTADRDAWRALAERIERNAWDILIEHSTRGKGA